VKNNDMINLLRLVEGQQFAGEPEQQPGDQVRGTDQAVVKGKQHPFHDRLVGEDTTLEDVLSKKYSDFKDVQAKEKEEKEKQDVEEGAPIATTSKSIEPGGAVDNFKQQMANNTEIDYQKKQQGMAEAKADFNFNAEDLKRLEKIRDLPTLKAMAFALISAPSAKPMKPEKVEWFKGALERMNSPMKVIKLMYDLMLSGEGQSVIGTRSSMNPNSYRQRFGEQGMAEGRNEIATGTPDAIKVKIKELGLGPARRESTGSGGEAIFVFRNPNYYVSQGQDGNWVLVQTNAELDQHGVAEGSQRVDSLVTDALKIMRGSDMSDAVAALKTVLGDREFSGRRGHYNFYVRQLMDMYGQRGVGEQQVNELGATPVAPPQGTATASPTQTGTAKPADGSISPDEQVALNKINQNPAMKQQLDKLMTQATPGGASAPVKLDQDEQDALNKIKSNAGLGTQYAKLIKQANPASNIPAVKP
jgi:hypothetical protein